MLSLQEISDRLEIQQVIANYTYAVDRHDWDLFDTVFTDDAVLDYSEVADKRGTRQEFRAWLSSVMPEPGTYQHLTATSTIRLEGDRAEVSTLCFNPMLPIGEGRSVVGHWYHDRFVRTADGWRVQERRFQLCYTGMLLPRPAPGV